MEKINKVKAYIQNNKLSFWTGFCSLLIGITVLWLWCHQCFIFGDERLSGNRLWEMASLAPFFYMFGGVTLIIAVTRQMGWVLLGCAVACSSLLGMILTFFPEYQPCGTTIIVIAVLMAAYLLCISCICALRDKKRWGKLKLEHQEKIVQLTFQLDMQGKKNVAFESKITGLANTNNELCEKIKKQDKLIDAQSQSNTGLRAELEISNRHLFESQLSSELHIMLASKSDSLPFAVNNFQGSYDKSLSDIIGMTNGTFWMVELKREKRDMLSERNKIARKKQYEMLNDEQNKWLRNISDKCHWMGCGTQTEKEATSIYSPYWPAFENGMPDNAIKLDEFTNRAFSNDNPVGVLFESFKCYTDFLIKCCDGNDATEKDIPFLLFGKDKNGKFRSMKTELHAVNEYIKKQKIDVKEEKKQEVKQQKSKGIGQSM